MVDQEHKMVSNNKDDSERHTCARRSKHDCMDMLLYYQLVAWWDPMGPKEVCKGLLDHQRWFERV
eukprot:6211127-Pleurochrysis_carterae.AAC.2